jgi:mycofactocin precursor
MEGTPMEQTLEQAETDELVIITDADDIAEEELLVEEISIDGMCGVY